MAKNADKIEEKIRIQINELDSHLKGGDYPKRLVLG
jgi:hypothetical protein